MSYDTTKISLQIVNTKIGVIMKYGTGILLLVIGAILSFAVKDSIEGVDLELIGFILMGAGVVGLIIAAVLTSKASSKGIVSEKRELHNPDTGERIVRNESKEI